MRAWQHWLQRLPQHKYAIQAKLLGDDAVLAWTNLGDWSARCGQLPTYPQACENLAHRLAQRLNLNAQDRVLDLGCGQGASLKLWTEHYAVQQLEAVEVQSSCVLHIQQNMPYLPAIHELDFLNLNQFEFQPFDVVLCLDAAYHVRLANFLSSIQSVLKPQARIGFHTLMWSERAAQLNFVQKQRYRFLLKAADIELQHLMPQAELHSTLTEAGFTNIEIIDLSSEVLKGFADYIQLRCPQNLKTVEGFKIGMTAKLCRSLYAEGYLQYVQVTAVQAG